MLFKKKILNILLWAFSSCFFVVLSLHEGQINLLIKNKIYIKKNYWEVDIAYVL